MKLFKSPRVKSVNKCVNLNLVYEEGDGCTREESRTLAHAHQSIKFEKFIRKNSFYSLSVGYCKFTVRVCQCHNCTDLWHPSTWALFTRLHLKASNRSGQGGADLYPTSLTLWPESHSIVVKWYGYFFMDYVTDKQSYVQLNSIKFQFKDLHT